MIEILTTVQQTPPDSDHAMTLEPEPVLMVILHTHASVRKAMMVTTAP